MAITTGKEESYLVSRLDQGIVLASLDGKLDTKPEALHVSIGRVAEEDRRMDLGLVDDLLLARAGADELERTEKARWADMSASTQ